ncbi:MAG: glycosyltransferase family 2 protein [Candidatus Eremiobacteraeota bacterium]|nr:glycosyltransferase family 2 protein [Candidatus Eremiobacteraeota bacterium]
MASLSSPLVSVVMPAYNCQSHLGEAISSMLGQTLTDFEFIIIDDGSTDGTPAALERHRRRDARISVVSQNHGGLGAALLVGCKLARGDFIARMDADDVSMPERLAQQVAFFEAHPEVGLCGTWAKTVGDDPGHEWRYPTDPDVLRCRLIFGVAHIHPTLMMRRSLMIRAGLTYDPAYTYAEDYDLYARCAGQVSFANIPRVLLLYRTHPQQAGRRYAEPERRLQAGRVQRDLLKHLDVQVSDRELTVHQCLSDWRTQPNRSFIAAADSWLRKLALANERTGCYPEPAFSRVLAERWFYACNLATELRWWTWNAFWHSPLASDARLEARKKIDFALRCRWAVKTAA